MKLRYMIITVLLLCTALPAAAGELVLPVFAHNLDGRNGNIWSSEIYLTNPSDQPVLVEIARFLPGNIDKPTPCDLFMGPTRVVPPQSATVWTASGLATDLGCAERVRGGLVLRADGPVHITSRLVNLVGNEDMDPGMVLSGLGEAFEAMPIEDLPPAGAYLLPALMWHQNPCGTPAFDTAIGFSNPGFAPVEVTLDVPHETGRTATLDGRQIALPYLLKVPAGSWRQYRLAPSKNEGPCGDVESFLVRLETSAPLAFYASVIDRKSGDPRTVLPVSLELP